MGIRVTGRYGEGRRHNFFLSDRRRQRNWGIHNIGRRRLVEPGGQGETGKDR